MKIDDSRSFKDTLIKYSVSEHRGIKFMKNEKKVVKAKCVDENCLWKISASLDVRTGSFHVKTYHEKIHVVLASLIRGSRVLDWKNTTLVQLEQCQL